MAVILQKQKRLAYTTIMTVMGNLYKKGFLTRQKNKKTYYYAPVAREKHLTHGSLGDILDILSRQFGKRKMFALLFTSSLPLRLNFKFAFFNPSLPFYKTPMFFGFSVTIFFAFLLFSLWQLLENLQLSGAFDYAKLIAQEPGVLPAVWESLPIINLSTTIAFLVLIVIFAKKFGKIEGIV